MFIFFGTRDRQETRGVVADLCPSCKGARAFKVLDHFNVGHLYYIPLGRGSYQGSGMKCSACGTEYRFEAGKFPNVVPESLARAISFEDLARQTNPRLHDHLAGRDEPEPARGRIVCGQCGHERDAEFRFCPVCGAPAHS